MLDTVLLKKSESLVRTLREFRVDPRASFRMLEQGMSADPASRLTVSPEAVGRIIESYAKAVEAQEKAAPAYRLGGEWVAIIRREKAEFLDAFKTRNKANVTRLLRSYFRNAGSAGLVDYGRYEVIEAAPFWRKAQFINNILHDVSVWTKLCRKTVASLACSPYGNTWGLVIDGVVALQTACRHHYWAERCLEIVRDAPRPVIAEIGGGNVRLLPSIRPRRPHLYQL